MTSVRLSRQDSPVLARVLIRDSFRADLLAKALSWISISFVVALGWPAIFYLLGGASLLLAMAVARVTFPLLNEEPVQSSAWPSYWRILRDRAFLLPALADGLGYGVIIAFNTAAPLILQGPFNWLAVESGLLGWPISLSLANDGSPVGGAYAMALSGFIHQLMAAIIGAIASLIASQQAWPLSLFCTLLALGAMVCVRLAPGRQTD